MKTEPGLKPESPSAAVPARALDPMAGARPAQPGRLTTLTRGAHQSILTTLEQAKNWRELRQTPYGFGPIVILALLGFFQALDSAVFGIAAPNIAQDLGIDLRGIIGIQTTIGVLVILGAIPVAWYFDRHPRAKWVGIGAIVSAITAMFQTRATSFGTLLAPRAVDDVAGSLAGTPIFSLVADYYPPESRGRVYALFGLSGQLTSLVALVAGGLSVFYFGWRVAGFIFAVPILVMGYIATVRLREPVRGYFERKALGVSDDVALREEEPVSIGEAWRTIIAVRTFRRLLLASIWGSGGLRAFGLLLPFFMADEYGLNALQRSLVGLPSIMLSLAGYYLGGGLIDYFSRRKPSSLLLFAGVVDLVAAVSLIGVAVRPPLVLLVFGSALLGFASSLSAPAEGAVYSQIIPPHVRTLGSALLSLGVLPGLVIIAPTIGQIEFEYGYTAALLLAVPFIVLAAIIRLSAAPLFELDRRNAFIASLAGHQAREAREAGTTKLLTVRNVDVEYDGVQVLFDVSLEVEEGEIIALLGTNGAGKSTLLRAISGSQVASNGAVVYDGRDITHMPPHEIAARGIVTMPGGRGVFPGLTVSENLLLGNWMTEDPDEVERRLAEVYEMFPILRERAGAHATDLSGGEQQQLSLAQAFLCSPRLLLIDELSLGLSPAIVGQLLETVREIHRRGVTIIVVEQSVNVALNIADKAVFMEKGEIRFEGPTAELMRRPDILRAVYVKGAGALTTGTGTTEADRRRQRELGSARAILEVDDLTKRFGGITAVDDVSFTVREGEILGIIGPNGSGKTTLFDLISGFQSPDEGRVVFDGEDITHLPPEARAQRRLVRRFQDARMFGSLTVFETLLIALEQRLEVKSALLAAFAAPQARRAERRVRLRADRLIELLELGAYRDKFVNELSTGLRRIVDLGCVLASEPKLLLLDEPSAGIAQAEAESLGPLLAQVRFETGCSMLLIEHDMPLISSVSDELMALESGHFVTRGLPSEVLDDPRVIEAYLGGSEEAIHRSGSTR